MWDLANFRIAENSGTACSFGFELQVHDNQTGALRVLHGDGLLLTDGRVRFNREEQLSQVAGELELERHQFLDDLADLVRHRAGRTAFASA